MGYFFSKRSYNKYRTNFKTYTIRSLRLDSVAKQGDLRVRWLSWYNNSNFSTLFNDETLSALTYFQFDIFGTNNGHAWFGPKK